MQIKIKVGKYALLKQCELLQCQTITLKRVSSVDKNEPNVVIGVRHHASV